MAEDEETATARYIAGHVSTQLLTGRYFRIQHGARNPYSMRVAELHVSSKIPTTQ